PEGERHDGPPDSRGHRVRVLQASADPGGRTTAAAAAGPADGRRAGTGARHGVLRRAGRGAGAEDGRSRRITSIRFTRLGAASESSPPFSFSLTDQVVVQAFRPAAMTSDE